MAIQHATDETFEQLVLKNEKPVVVDFWATWCGPCKAMNPAIESLAKELEGKLKVVKLNIDEAQEKAGELGITAVPTLMLFKAGKLLKSEVGAKSLPQLKQMVQPAL
jgi:thioredoxin